MVVAQLFMFGACQHVVQHVRPDVATRLRSRKAELFIQSCPQDHPCLALFRSAGTTYFSTSKQKECSEKDRICRSRCLEVLSSLDFDRFWPYVMWMKRGRTPELSPLEAAPVPMFGWFAFTAPTVVKSDEGGNSCRFLCTEQNVLWQEPQPILQSPQTDLAR